MARKKHKHSQKEQLAGEKRFDQLVTTTVARVQNFWQRNGVIIRAWLVFAAMIALFTTLLLVLNLYTNFDSWLNSATAAMLAGALWLLAREARPSAPSSRPGSSPPRSSPSAPRSSQL